MPREIDPKLFVVSAPSGAGKTTLCRRLLGENLPLADSVSMTTRRPRTGEHDGVDYHFVSKARFLGMVRRGEFLEYEENFGYFYGTPKKFIEDNFKKGISVLLSIDVKGAMKIRRAYREKSILVFILPPSEEILRRRLVGRMSDSRKAIAKRLAFAKKEMSYKNRYDYKIVNDKLESAYRKLKKIVASELTKSI